MTVDLLTNPGGLFRRLGKNGNIFNDINTNIGSTLSTDIAAVDTEYPTRQDLVEGLHSATASYRRVHGTMTSYLRTLAQNTVIGMVHDDNPLPSKDLSTAMTELIRQMTANSESVNGSSASVSVTADSNNTGTSVVIASVLDKYGQTLQYAFDEDIILRIQTDSQSGGTARQEQYTISGEAAAQDVLGYDWPAGSGASSSGTVVNPTLDASNNRLTNSDFESFTGSTPDKWTVTGSNVSAGGLSHAQFGSNSLAITGDDAEQTTIHQDFNSSTGTTARLSPATVYAVNLWSKVSAVPANGVLRVALVDGSNTVVNDDAGTANSFTVDLTGETTSFASHNGFFRTPSVLPSTLRIQLKLTTVLEDTIVLYIDDLAMTAALQTYVGGPYVAVFPSATNPVIGDRWTIAVTSTLGAFQKLFERYFSMRSLGLTIPFDASASETIADSLLS